MMCPPSFPKVTQCYYKTQVSVTVATVDGTAKDSNHQGNAKPLAMVQILCLLLNVHCVALHYSSLIIYRLTLSYWSCSTKRVRFKHIFTPYIHQDCEQLVGRARSKLVLKIFPISQLPHFNQMIGTKYVSFHLHIGINFIKCSFISYQWPYW